VECVQSKAVGVYLAVLAGQEANIF